MALAPLVIVVAFFSGTAAAGPASSTITADNVCCEYSSELYEQTLGEISLFVNPAEADAPHNVASTVRGPDGGPLFRSETIGVGSTSPIAGTQYLSEGTYPFYCTLHGLSMDGQLEVVPGGGAAVPRPAIRVSVLPQSLRAVRRSGIINASVRALVGSPTVNLEAKSGAVAVAYANGLSLRPGVTKTVRLKLSKAGRRAVSKGRQALISVKGSVAFGSPVLAKRTVR